MKIGPPKDIYTKWGEIYEFCIFPPEKNSNALLFYQWDSIICEVLYKYT